MLDQDRPPIYSLKYSHLGSLTTIDPLILNNGKLEVKLALKYLFGLDFFNLNMGVSHADELFVVS